MNVTRQCARSPAEVVFSPGIPPNTCTMLLLEIFNLSGSKAFAIFLTFIHIIIIMIVIFTTGH